MENAMPIPKVLHQTWKSKELPASFAAFRQTWQRHHPDWSFPLYDDADCRRLVVEHYPELVALYDNYPTNVQRADLFRYLVVHRYGGVYADVDMECLRPIAPLLVDRACVFGVEARFGEALRRKLKYRKPYQVANCIFAAVPRHPLLTTLLARLPRDLKSDGDPEAMVEESTGPRLLTRVFQDACERLPDVTLLPQINWLPPMRPAYPNWPPFNWQMYCRHHFAGTWKSARSDARPWLVRWRERWYLPWPWPRATCEA
jgi:inositol phosphorylceramide mannosyltransferase catalytic subunit